MDDREKLIELIEKWNKDEFAISYASYELADYLITNGVVIQTQGEWVLCYEDWRKQIDGDKCTACGFEHYGTVINHYKYCPNCGAKMKEVK